jgi:hypothetical protein
MRYYEITITDAKTGAQVAQFSTLKQNGEVNGSALRAVVDIPVAPNGSPNGLGYIKLFGVSFEDLNHSHDFNGQTVSVRLGMSKGLPLANASQAGVVITGTVYQSFGNWQGNDVTLDLIISPVIGKPATQGPINSQTTFNLSAQWAPGQTLESCIRQTLSTAFPKCKVTGSLSPNLVLNQADVGIYQNIQQFANQINKISKTIIPDVNYQGANIVTGTNNTFILFDGTIPLNAPFEISFLDLIGNATWIDVNTLQFKNVMRGDLFVGQVIKMPIGANLINTQSSYSQFRNNSSFQGQYMIMSLRHVGDSRQLSADSWVTIAECVIQP